MKQVSVQNVQQYSIIAEGIEHITLALTHYTIVERLYLRRSNESTVQLRNNLTKLYACILKFLIKSQRFYEKGTALKSSLHYVLGKRRAKAESFNSQCHAKDRERQQRIFTPFE